VAIRIFDFHYALVDVIDAAVFLFYSILSQGSENLGNSSTEDLEMLIQVLQLMYIRGSFIFVLFAVFILTIVMSYHFCLYVYTYSAYMCLHN